jgi:molybdopterin molybdotransferase
MISVQDALRLVLDGLPVIGCERVMLRQAGRRVLGESLVAGRDVPPFRNSAMDGYAVRAADVAGAERRPARLRVLEVIGAGSSPSQTVVAGTATKIMTGSPVPDGADSVVKVEDTSEEAGEVVVRVAVAAGANVRHPGEDMRAGESVLGPGRLLRPADIGLLASLSVASVLVRRQPRVAILSTGDELVDVGEAVGPGQIVNSNAYTLAAAVEEAGAVPVLLGVARDRPDTLRQAYADALRADVVLSTGGVSVGSFDYVREVQADLGVVEKFWKVAQKPGKPLTYGLHGGTPVFGLPGNPVSTLVCFYIYVLPALRRLMGMERPFLPAVDAVVEADIATVAGLTEFVRCQLEEGAGGYRARPTGSQSSGVLRSMSAGDALVVSPAGTAVLRQGSRVRAIVLAREAAAAEPPF